MLEVSVMNEPEIINLRRMPCAEKVLNLTDYALDVGLKVTVRMKKTRRGIRWMLSGYTVDQ